MKIGSKPVKLSNDGLIYVGESFNYLLQQRYIKYYISINLLITSKF